METKRCSTCHKIKYAEKFHTKNNKLVARCKKCLSKKAHKWYLKNRSHRIAMSKTWSQANKEKTNLSKKKWLLKHPNYRNEWRRAKKLRLKLSLEKPAMAKIICIDCGGMSYDTRFTKCGPCRVKDNVQRMTEIRSLLSF